MRGCIYGSVGYAPSSSADVPRKLPSASLNRFRARLSSGWFLHNRRSPHQPSLVIDTGRASESSQAETDRNVNSKIKAYPTDFLERKADQRRKTESGATAMEEGALRGLAGGSCVLRVFREKHRGGVLPVFPS